MAGRKRRVKLEGMRAGGGGGVERKGGRGGRLVRGGQLRTLGRRDGGAQHLQREEETL